MEVPLGANSVSFRSPSKVCVMSTFTRMRSTIAGVPRGSRSPEGTLSVESVVMRSGMGVGVFGGVNVDSFFERMRSEISGRMA